VNLVLRQATLKKLARDVLGQEVAFREHHKIVGMVLTAKKGLEGASELIKDQEPPAVYRPDQEA
jgi:hypothetical protein